MLHLLELLHTCHLREFEMIAIPIQLIFGALVLLFLSVGQENFHIQLMKVLSILCCRYVWECLLMLFVSFCLIEHACCLRRKFLLTIFLHVFLLLSLCRKLVIWNYNMNLATHEWLFHSCNLIAPMYFCLQIIIRSFDRSWMIHHHHHQKTSFHLNFAPLLMLA